LQIPKKVKIGGYEIKVCLADNLMVERGNVGEYNPREQVISIDNATTTQQRQEVFIHEVLEAITSIYDIDFVDHKDLSNMAVVIYQVIKDNNEVFR
jgi:hypothetical protein